MIGIGSRNSFPILKLMRTFLFLPGNEDAGKDEIVEVVEGSSAYNDVEGDIFQKNMNQEIFQKF